MAHVYHLGRRHTEGVQVDEDGYVVLSPDAWHYYARLFARNGICATQALDTLDDFDTALSLCTKQNATVHQLRRT